MRELLRTNDPVRIARLRALLDDQGVTTFLFDTHLSMAFAGALDLARIFSTEPSLVMSSAHLLAAGTVGAR